MSGTTVIALLMFLFPLAYSPGPGNAFFAAIGASHGIRAAIPALSGYHMATFITTAVVGLGVGLTLLVNPVVSLVLSAVGSLYVLWLAISFFRAARAKAHSSTHTPVKEHRIGFWAGVIVLLVNPKAYYILAVMFTQFLPQSEGNEVVAVLVITTVFTLNNLVAFVVWTLGGRALTALFRSERSRRWIDYLFAGSLLGVAVYMATPLFT